MNDPVRFEAFVREYQDMVFATAARLCGNHTEAEDVAQTVFVRAFEHFDRIADDPSVAGWLKTVTTNLCLNHLTRYRARWRLFSELDRVAPGGGAMLFVDSLVAPTPRESSGYLDQRRDLARALRTLPAHQRVPLVLFHFDEMSYQAIADRLSVSLAKVKTDIHRGREALKAALENADA
jgi:RNA polymerase sigma-70 factor (ECF subfamily)